MSRNLTDQDLAAIRNLMTPEELGMLDVLAEAITGRETQTLILGLMRLTVLSAILAGVDAKNFAGGMKATWDFYADELNKAALRDAEPKGRA